MINLFIDSNVWLSLYSFSKNDLESFNKLLELIDSKIKLYVPEQTRDEVFRNRDGKISETIKKLKEYNLIFPAFSKKYTDYEKLYSDYKTFKKELDAFIDIIQNDLNEFKLPADEVISNFFNKSEKIKCEEVIENAIVRYRRGNPPGKNNSYGDAITWESLLKFVPDNEDLYFISDDKDYKNVGTKNFNSFLDDEWSKRKKGKIYFYTEIRTFLEKIIKDIKLSDEEEFDKLIDSLICSPNFEITHKIIYELGKHSDDEFTENRIFKICEAYLSNNQVKWIINDTDVYEFYNRFFKVIDGDNIEESILDFYTKHI